MSLSLSLSLSVGGPVGEPVRSVRGHTPSASLKQWGIFSWNTVASLVLPSHWSTPPTHSQRQEAVTNRNGVFDQSEWEGDSLSKSLSSIKSVLSSRFFFLQENLFFLKNKKGSVETMSNCLYTRRESLISMLIHLAYKDS